MEGGWYGGVVRSTGTMLFGKTITRLGREKRALKEISLFEDKNQLVNLNSFRKCFKYRSDLIVRVKNRVL